MEITKNTRVSDILDNYGDIAPVMAVFGVRSVARFSIRRILTKFLTVERAAKIHRVPLEDFLDKLQKAVKLKTNV